MPYSIGSIKSILMTRDNMDEAQAESLIEEARQALNEYLADGDIDSAEDVCAEFFGLEPDYLMQLI
jgi:hypothetical protein